LVGLILGIVGCLFGLIPLTFWIAGTLGVIGLILALVGFARTRRGEATNKKTAIAGIATNALALVLAVVGVVIVGNAFSQFGKDIKAADTQVVAPTSSDASASDSTDDSSAGSDVTDTTDPSTSADDSAYNDMPIGQSITVSGTNNDTPYVMDLKAVSIKKSKAAIEDYGNKPKGSYVGILVEYTCTQGTCSYNPFDFKVRNSDGDEFDSSSSSFTPGLESGDLRHGRKARGYITYDLPKGKYVLEYSAGFADTTSASWKFSV